MSDITEPRPPQAEDDPAVGLVTHLTESEMDELCEATALAVADGEDIAWVRPPQKPVLTAFWKGVLLAPHRRLIAARHDGRICGAVQLLLPGAVNEAGAHAGELATFFVAPWARGHGLAKMLIETAEGEARNAKLKVLDLSIRADRTAGIALVESLGYARWAEKPHYAFLHGRFHPGYYYTKRLER